MDKYMLHCDFYTSDMDNMDVVLGYPWMESMGTVNISVQNKFPKLQYKNKKSTLQDICIKTQAEDVLGTEKLDDEPFMVDNQKQISNQVHVESKEAEAENVTSIDTSDEELVVEVILEDKQQ